MSGNEEKIRSRIYEQNLGEVIIPMKEKPFKIDGKWIVNKEKMTPGYIFVYSGHQSDYFTLRRIDKVLRVLSYSDSYEDSYLKGDDLDYALSLKKQNGEMKALKAVKEGDFVRIKDTVIGGKEARVKKINKRRHMVEVELEFMGEKRSLWLGYEMIENR